MGEEEVRLGLVEKCLKHTSSGVQLEIDHQDMESLVNIKRGQSQGHAVGHVGATATSAAQTGETGCLAMR